MSNIYKEKFLNLVSELDLENYKHFTNYSINVNSEGNIKKWNIIKFNLNKRILNNAIELLKVKSFYTMDYDQSGIARNKNLKFINQLKGVLAEIGVHLILVKILDLNNVKRWDLERDSFNYTENEYDLKFNINNKDILCESRSSVSYKTSLKEFIENYHIIGPYISNFKQKENLNHFYFRPVFQYKRMFDKKM